MIRATELGGRAVIDMDAAEKLGKIEKVILDPDARRVAGFVVAHGASLLNEGTRITLPASAVHAIGPDAVTVRRDPQMVDEEPRLEVLPRVSDVVGRKVVTETGRLLGTVNDVLIDDEDGRIVAYTLADANNPFDKLEHLMSGDKRDQHPIFLKADADLRAGRDLIVAPESAVTRELASGGAVAPSLPPAPAGRAASRWAAQPPSAAASSEWIRDGRFDEEPPAPPRR
jgi:sporulation protein YlmC with PRC-barrel domain